MADKFHPVWNVYNEERTARINVLYLQVKLDKLIGRNFWMELVIAISASSTAAGFWFFQNWFGGYVLKSIAVIAALYAIIKPLLKIQNKITTKETALSGYQLLQHELHLIGIEVQNQKQYDNVLHKRFMKVMERKASLVGKDGEKTDEELRRQCYEQVKRELPSKSFYIPP